MNSAIVILVSSHKHGGVCLAGKLLAAPERGWVRPVRAFAGQPWYAPRLQQLAGDLPQVGGCLSLPLGVPYPEAHKQENRRMRFGPWRRHGRLGGEQLAVCEDKPQCLWG